MGYYANYHSLVIQILDNAKNLISGRSEGHAIDKIVLIKSGKTPVREFEKPEFQELVKKEVSEFQRIK